MITIPEAIRFIFEKENIKSKRDLDNWCGGRDRKKLYDYIYFMCPEHWNSIKTPKNSVRFYTQVLPGYGESVYKINN